MDDSSQTSTSRDTEKLPAVSSGRFSVIDFGVLAVKNGLLTRTQLEHCRRKQTSSANLGMNRTLEDIVLEERLMSEDDVTKVQRVQRQFIQDRENKADLKFKGYEIISTLGEGGLGTVYQARQVSMNRMVALKVLHKHWITDDEFRKRFVLEARLVGRLSHQNLIQVYDVGREGDYYYFSMEYVDGKTVEELIEEVPGRRLDVAEAVDIVIQVVRAIRYYKDLDNIVHRDIKPSNIMMTKLGLAKLGDFGFVKSQLDKELGAEGMVLGTPDYIAPEQAMGKPTVDYRADIYALGCSFFHMLTGRPPFEGRPSEVMLKHTREEIPNIKELRPSLSDDVVTVIDKMLAKDPDERYSNLNILFTDLERLLATHRAKAPMRVEVGKSSALRALKMERAKLNDLENTMHRLQAQVSGMRMRQMLLLIAAIVGVLWGIGATIAALI